MGAGIAQVAAAAGHQVYLFDAVGGAAGKAIAAISKRMERSVSKGRRSEQEARALVDRIRACDRLAELAPAALFIEAIVEDRTIKSALLRELEELAGAEAVLGTNTSSLSVTELAFHLESPHRLVGMHFFNPAPAMPLVEIVSGSETDPAIADRAEATVAAWGKTPVRCASTPGFIVNRVARPFYGEALRLIVEGSVEPVTIDALLTGSGGFRMGPFALMDLVGIDVNLAVSKSVFEQTFNDTRFAPSQVQQALVDAGRLGRKSGRGVYDYGETAPVPVAATLPAQPAPERVEAHGDLGWAGDLIGRLTASGIAVDRVSAGGPGHLIFDGIHLMPSDGRTASGVAATQLLGTSDVAVFDLVHDWDKADRIGVAVADQAHVGTAERAAGLLQAAGYDVSAVDDTPGLAVLRTVAQLVAVAADAVTQGIATADDIDTAMRLGTNYPSGPLEWADRIGLDRLVATLDHLHAEFGEDRYRVPVLLRRLAATGSTFRRPDLD